MAKSEKSSIQYIIKGGGFIMEALPSDVIRMIFAQAIADELTPSDRGSTLLALALTCQRFRHLIKGDDEYRGFVHVFLSLGERHIVVSTAGNRYPRIQCRYHSECCTKDFADFRDGQCTNLVHLPFFLCCAPCMVAGTAAENQEITHRDTFNCAEGCAICMSVVMYPLCAAFGVFTCLPLGLLELGRCVAGGCCLIRCSRPMMQVKARIANREGKTITKVNADICCVCLPCMQMRLYAQTCKGIGIP